MVSCPVRVIRTYEDRLKRRDDRRIKLRFNRLSEPQARNCNWHCLTIRTLRRHRVVGIRNGDDSRQKRDRVSTESIRIAATVDPLVMVTYNLCDLVIPLNALKDPLPDHG